MSTGLDTAVLANENMRIPLFLTLAPFLTKNMQKKQKQKKSVKEQTQKIDSPRIFSPNYYALSFGRNFFFPKKSYFIAIYYWRVLNIFTLLLKTVHKIKQKKSFFQKKLLHSYLLLKGAQYFSLLLKTVNKIKQKNIFFQKSYFIAIYYWRVLNIFTLLLKTVNKIKQKNSFFQKKLLHSYLLLKDAQYFYIFAESNK